MDANGSPTSLLDVAARVVWFSQPQETLKDPCFFLNHVMVHGRITDIVETRRYFDDDALRHALKHAHPGIWDQRSWSYWHTVLDMLPIPSMPVRFPGIDKNLIGYGGPPKTAPAS